MGDSTLVKLASPPTEVKSSTDDLNQILDALYGDIVMRNTSGVVTDGAGDIGQINSGRPDRIHVKTGITIGGQTLNTSPFLLSKTGIQSGAAKTSGFPNFLLPAGGTTRTFDILGATTPLNMTIDGTAYSLEADLTSDELELAPASNNTCLVNDLNISDDPYWSKTIGEFGYWITIDTVGSEITALNGTIQCFKISNGSETEFFIAEVDTTNNMLIPILRGIGGTERIAFSNNDVITLLKAHYVFLSNDLLNIETSTVYPTWSADEPDGPEEGFFWFDVSNKTWKRYSGSSWEITHTIYLGYVLCDSSGAIAVEHENFDLQWDEMLLLDQISVVDGNNIRLEGDFKINVSGELVFLQNQQKNIDVSDILESGTSLVENNWYYLYISKTGKLYFSSRCPRKYDNRSGLYHPLEYYRCFGMFRTHDNVGGNFQLFPLINIPENGEIILDYSENYQLLAENTGITIGAFQAYNLNVPPIIKKVKFNFYVIYNGNNVSGTVYSKELSRFLTITNTLALFSAQRDSLNNYSYFGQITNLEYVRNGMIGLLSAFNGSPTTYKAVIGFNVKF